jgi:diguanylate cyclase (GGDEF)-like protein/PAS domain S-box-containing protein
MTEPIKLGLMAPISGIVEMYGPEIVNAALIAADEINRTGGVLGRHLDIHVEDDGSFPDTAVRAADRLVREQGCQALVGTLLSNSRIDVADHVSRVLRVPYLNYSFYEGGISSRYFFHFAALPNQQIDPMISAMVRLHGPRMFFAGNDYEWPRGSIDACKRRLVALEGDVVGEEYLPFSAGEAGIDEVLDRVARSGANVLIPYFAGRDQILLLKRFAALGLKEQMAVAMGHFDELIAQELTPFERDGLFACNTFFMGVRSDEAASLVRRVSSGIDGMRPWGQGGPVLTNFGEAAYICVKAYAEAVRAAGSQDNSEILQALSQVRVIAPQGEVRMDPATNHARINTFLAKCRDNGSFDIVERFGSHWPEIPARYLSQPSVSDFEEPSLSVPPVSDAARDIKAVSRLLDAADVPLIAANEDGIITDLSPRAAEMFGFTVSELIGRSVHIMVPPYLRRRHAEHLRQFTLSDDTERRMGQRGQITGYRKDGTYFPVEASIAKYRDGNEWRLVVTFRDVTSDRRAAADLVYRSTHDMLTGLPNRESIIERIGKALARAQRKGLGIALMFVDLDGFKTINDRFGHQAGDEVLKESARRLATSIRPGDTVGRLAGDEFLVLCESIDVPEAISSVAERLVDMLARPVKVGADSFSVTASIGVAIGSSETHSPEDLIRAADTAMYSVKRQGRAGWLFFNPDLQREAEERLMLSVGVRSAIDRNELKLLFQPIVDAGTGIIKGAEALLRWDPPGGPISPVKFIPVAEANGSIVPIGYWVFEQACQVARRWSEALGAKAPYVSVNVSARQLGERRLVRQFQEILAATGAKPESMLIEITETSLMSDVARADEVLRGIASLGMQIAVDDFGTGYSSLAQLQRLNADVLKIDKEFVQSIDRDIESRVVVDAICRIGRSLNMRLIAEGVETQEQRATLQALGCQGIQGYLFYKPMPADAVLAECRSSRIVSVENQDLHYLVYFSKIAPDLNEAALKEILTKARRSNASKAVTGYLFMYDDAFVQYIEGPSVGLQDVFQRIQQDPRHHALQVVARGSLSKRLFAGWFMGFHDFKKTKLTVRSFEGTRAKSSYEWFKYNPELCLALFEVLSGRE